MYFLLTLFQTSKSDSIVYVSEVFVLTLSPSSTEDSVENCFIFPKQLGLFSSAKKFRTLLSNDLSAFKLSILKLLLNNKD